MIKGETLELPPFVDMHVHCREPGTNPAETIASATEAAADGGVGVVNDMSNNAPQPTSTLEALNYKLKRASESSVVVYGAASGIQPEYDNIGQISRMLPKSFLVKIYGGPTTNINRNSDYEAGEFDEGLDQIKDKDPDTLVVFHSGEHNYRDFIGHAAGDRNLRVQLAHVNKIDQVNAVIDAKEKGWDVEASICPHTMLLTQHDRKTRSAYADMQPPLVSQEDAEALFQAFADGDIAILETDHAPHTHQAKRTAIDENPGCLSTEYAKRCCGVPGLEFAAKLMFWQVHLGNLSLTRLVDGYSTRPADRLRIRLSSDSKVVWDMNDFRIENEATQVKSLSEWSPYLGMMAMGSVLEMKLSGNVVYRLGQVIEPVKKVVSGNYEQI